MPDLRCTECGNYVRVQGLAATCPHCGNLVTVNQPQEQAGLPELSPPPEQQSYKTPIELPIPVQAIPVSQSAPAWKYVAIAAAIMLGLVLPVDWLRLSRKRAGPATVATTPPPAVTQPPTSPPQPAPSIFSEETTPPRPEPTTLAIIPAPTSAAAEPKYPHTALAAVRPTPPEHSPAS